MDVTNMFENLGFSKKRDPVWPTLPDGTPETPALLTHISTYDMNGDIVLGLLESFGIPALTQYPGNGGFDRVLQGMSIAGVDVYVPESVLEDAKALLEGDAGDRSEDGETPEEDADEDEEESDV